MKKAPMSRRRPVKVADADWREVERKERNAAYLFGDVFAVQNPLDLWGRVSAFDLAALHCVALRCIRLRSVASGVKFKGGSDIRSAD